MGWDLKQIDDDTVASVNSTSREALDLVATYCREAGEAQKSGGDFKHAATVPGWVIVDWCNKHGITFKDLMRDNKIQDRFLNDPANAPFRVWKGRI